MPKIIFENNEKDLIPENLKNAAKELEDGTFELDAKGILKKNKELLRDNASLEAKVETAESKAETAEARAKEWKSKANLADDKRIVDADVAELGEAAKTAGVEIAEIPTLKTASVDLQKQIDSLKGEKTLQDVAGDLKLNKRFVLAAQDKGWKFEKVGEGEEAVWNHVDGEKKTPVDEFFKTDTYAKEFADTFTDAESGNQWVQQESGKHIKGKTIFDEIEAEVKAEQKNRVPSDNASVLTALGGIPIAK